MGREVHKCNEGAPEPNVFARKPLVELSNQHEYMKLKARYESLQRSQRDLLGEELGPLSSNELESLERLMEGYKVRSLQLNPTEEDVSYGRQPPQPYGDSFFHQLDCEPTLQIGYQIDQIAVPVSAMGPSVNNYMPGWLR
ncbi:hypothetical protein Ddye_001956 [Dipteronia dyeriana]|uniref:K-box domain-containing protein n=1 Tax=Dipteronia dyeriana TaxID=168575 RepID=A0AAD9XQ25_9ROSI|nr:hypothetical protein Ddye_001956 [Dipteronia dyeriana]